ncbi:MAG: EamA family transporter, partial [Kurthia sp.]
MSRVIPYVVVLIAAMLWGTVGTTKTYVTSDANPLSIAMFRSILGGGLLMIVAAVFRKINFRQWPWKLTIYSALCMALFQPLFFISVEWTGVAVGTVVAIGSSPIFAGLIEWTVLKEKPNNAWRIATILAITGCILLFFGQQDRMIEPIGIVTALLAGVVFATYTNVTKELLKKEASLPAVGMIFTLSGIMLLPFSIYVGVGWIMESVNWLPMLVMAFFGTSIAYLLFFRGLRQIESSAAVTLS